jgi:hypothetical protein
MTLEEVTRALKKAGYRDLQTSRLGNETGSQLRFVSPQVVNVFDNGTVTVQGKPPIDVAKLLEE